MKFLKIFNLKAMIYQSRNKMLLVFAGVSELPKFWAAISCLNPDFLSYESGYIQNSLLWHYSTAKQIFLFILSSMPSTSQVSKIWNSYLSGLKPYNRCYTKTSTNFLPTNRSVKNDWTIASCISKTSNQAKKGSTAVDNL